MSEESIWALIAPSPSLSSVREELAVDVINRLATRKGVRVLEVHRKQWPREVSGAGSCLFLPPLASSCLHFQHQRLLASAALV